MKCKHSVVFLLLWNIGSLILFVWLFNTLRFKQNSKHLQTKISDVCECLLFCWCHLLNEYVCIFVQIPLKSVQECLIDISTGWSNGLALTSHHLNQWWQVDVFIGPNKLNSSFRGYKTYDPNLTMRCLVAFRADSRLAPSQWEMSLQSNIISYWLGANLESTLAFCTIPLLKVLCVT